jgi:hypothetical protein
MPSWCAPGTWWPKDRFSTCPDNNGPVGNLSYEIYRIFGPAGRDFSGGGFDRLPATP